MNQSPEPITGQSLPIQGHEQQNPHGDSPAVFLPLRLVLQTNNTVVTVTKPDAIVGRHSLADITLRPPEISRRHCRFVFADGLWHVFDLQSLNGLFVNGERVQQATLRHGDTIQIGSLLFAVDLRNSPPAASLAADDSQTARKRILAGISEALHKPSPQAAPDKLAS